MPYMTQLLAGPKKYRRVSRIGYAYSVVHREDLLRWGPCSFCLEGGVGWTV